jgi:NAD(P)-dependent dehydrogenase (short-subunit alcohol dehydrogenase family)
MPTSKTYEPHAGRVALVTGASRGIGQAVAVGLAVHGARVVLGGRGDASETIALIADTGHPAVPVRLDVSDRSSIEAARDRVADELGHVDILVNNAGTFEGASWDDLDFDLWQRVMTTDLNGPMLMCKAFLPLMRGRGWGRVINIASATVAIASPVSIAYRTAKMGVIGFTRALSATLGDEGITINAVLPSLTRTAMTEGIPQAIVDASDSASACSASSRACSAGGSPGRSSVARLRSSASTHRPVSHSARDRATSRPPIVTPHRPGRRPGDHRRVPDRIQAPSGHLAASRARRKPLIVPYEQGEGKGYTVSRSILRRNHYSAEYQARYKTSEQLPNQEAANHRHPRKKSR